MLKLSSLQSVANGDKIENGSWLHLSDADGNPLYLDEEKTKPIRALVRSSRSKAYERFEDRLQAVIATRQKRAKPKEHAAIRDRAYAEHVPESFAAVLVGLENANAEKPGYEVAEEKDSIATAREPNWKWLVDQVVNFAFDDSNFSGLAEGNDRPPAGGKKTSQSE